MTKQKLTGRGGPGRGQGRKKETPPDAKRHNITVTDAELVKIQELIKQMRETAN